MASSQQPTHRVFAIVKREGQEDFWLPVGAAFAHKDGRGFNVILQALPLEGKVVLREPQADEAEQPPTIKKHRGEHRER
jgi:hypothetical protein